jgi:hypothetical protein
MYNFTATEEADKTNIFRLNAGLTAAVVLMILNSIAFTHSSVSSIASPQ